MHKYTALQALIGPHGFRRCGAVNAVKGDDGNFRVVGAHQVQVILHFLDRPSRRADAQRRTGVSARAFGGRQQAVDDACVHLVDLVPGQLAHQTVHGKPVELLESAHSTLGGGAEDAVRRDGRDGAVGVGDDAQIKLHLLDVVAAAAYSERGAGELARSIDVGRGDICLDRAVFVVDAVPGRLSHDAVHRQAEMLLEGAHGPVRGLAEDAVHRDGGNGVHKFGHGVEPELDLFHIVAAAAHTQQGAGPLAGYKVAGGGLAFAGKLRKLFDRYVNIADLVPGIPADNPVLGKAELLLKFFYHSLGRGAEHAVHLESAEEGVVAGDAVELALDGAHGIACAAQAQRCAGIAFGNGLNVVGAYDLNVVAVVILQDGQRVASLIGQRDGAPLLHAGAGYGFAVAVLGVIGVDGTDAAYVGVEDVVGNAAHHLEDVAAMDVVLVVAGGAGDLKIVAFAAVPFSIYAVQRQADLSVDVGPQGLLRPGGANQTHKNDCNRLKYYIKNVIMRMIVTHWRY